MTRVTIVGTGFVGISNALLLSQKNEVVCFDIFEERVNLINDKRLTVKDDFAETFWKERELDIRATSNKFDAYTNSVFVVIATPTNYDTESGYFDTSSVEMSIGDALKYAPRSTVIIKSTIPIGFVDKMRAKFSNDNIIFSPEFLREGTALYDNLHPSRIIVGDTTPNARAIADLLIGGAAGEHIDVLFTNPKEAESVKLFANTYLAMRVSFFNELDTFSMFHGLNSKQIIDGVTHDPRIGKGYANPSFGYGGYCFPKDTKQLLANFKGVPQTMIRSIVDANEIRKQAIIDQVKNKNPSTIGVYRLVMKAGSDNFRSSSIVDIMAQLRDEGFAIKIYEPTISSFKSYDIVNDIDTFYDSCDVIIGNRVPDDHKLKFADKLFTRDIYGDN